jgi:hypothetical protein
MGLEAGATLAGVAADVEITAEGGGGRGQSEGEDAPGERTADGREVIVAGEQGDPYGAVDRALVRAEGDAGRAQRGGLIERKLDLGRLELGQGFVEETIAGEQRLIAGDPGLVADESLDRQDVEAGVKVEREFASAELEAGGEGQCGLAAAQGDQRPRGRAGVKAEAEQAQEGEAGLLGDAVGPVEDALAEEGEQLEQGDAGVAGAVIVGPLRGVGGDSGDELLAEVVPAAIVEGGRGDGHGGAP